MSKQIQVRILPDGRIEAKTINIKGKQCLKLIKPLEELLQAQTTSSEFTHEYYETEEQAYTVSQVQEVQGNGR